MVAEEKHFEKFEDLLMWVRSGKEAYGVHNSIYAEECTPRKLSMFDLGPTFNTGNSFKDKKSAWKRTLSHLKDRKNSIERLIEEAEREVK